MFCRKKTLDNILAGFTKVRDDLVAFIDEQESKVKEHNDRVHELTRETGEIAQTSAHAEHTLNKVRDLIGE
jgi:methyl-accepting chemotaxis protein